MTLRVVLVHSTRSSKLGMAAGMDHLVEGPRRDGHRCGEPGRRRRA